MHLMLATRRDCVITVAYHSQFESNTIEHWISIKRILRYLKNTEDYGCFYCKYYDILIIAYADADWGNHPQRKSTSGFIIHVYGTTVVWTSRRHYYSPLINWSKIYSPGKCFCWSNVAQISSRGITYISCHSNNLWRLSIMYPNLTN